MKDYVKESQKHFDKQAEKYDKNTSTYYSGPAKISCADAEEYLMQYDYSKLLDIGCGTGFLIDGLSKKKDAEYYGLDLSEGMLEQAKKKNIRNAVFIQGTCDALPYEDNSFDIVTCIQSFHHYPDREKAMSEALRVLKPGGIYLLSDTGIGGIGAWIDNNILFRIMKSGDCHTADKEGIAELMKATGFRVLRNEQLKGMIYTVVGQKQLR